MVCLWLLLPLGFALLRLATGKYAFSALTSLACAFIALLPGPDADGGLLALGLLLSVAGDYMLAHQKGRPAFFLYGVAGFGAAHLAFILFAARRFAFAPLAFGFIAVLAALYALYLSRRVLPGQPKPLRLALLGYALVSLAGLFFALCLNAPAPVRASYVLGIACIVFSDTMIAEAEFARNKKARPFILPAYYLCHILIALSRLSGIR